MDEHEALPGHNFTVNLLAGAIAGILELCLMYPIDSVKTRMQSLTAETSNKGVIQILMEMIKHEGIFRPVRGIEVIAGTAGPAHAIYFASYEYLRDVFGKNQPLYLAVGISGAIATILHDLITNPAEVIKQRMQMANSPYKSIIDCTRRTYRNEGFAAFYKSYTTQLTMNIPFQIVHFVTYEFCRNFMNPEGKYNPKAHLLSGALAGGVAAAATTPLDVCKTLLNTQEQKVTGMANAFRAVYKIGGIRGFFRGIKARILYQMPSNAICWSVYELFKYILTGDLKFK